MKNNEFGDRLKKLRLQRGLSQEELAFQCSMQASHIGQIERKQKNPTFDTLVKIANGLDMSLTELLDFDISVIDNEQQENIRQINVYLKHLNSKQQRHILAIVKTFIDYK